MGRGTKTVENHCLMFLQSIKEYVMSRATN